MARAVVAAPKARARVVHFMMRCKKLEVNCRKQREFLLLSLLPHRATFIAFHHVTLPCYTFTYICYLCHSCFHFTHKALLLNLLRLRRRADWPALVPRLW